MTKLEEVATTLRLYVRDNDAALALEAARAAIEALREPTPDVLDAVQTAVDICPENAERPSSNYVEFISRDEARETWAAAIDAILKEKGNG